MAKTLAAIKVKIGLRPNGQADHPDFNALSVVQANKMDWSTYVDVHGLGWAYDKRSGHADDDTDSPAGQQWGVLLVPEQFAIEAVAQFPSLCTRLTDAELTVFWDTRAHAHLEEVTRDEGALNRLEREGALIDDALTDADTAQTTKLNARKTQLRREMKKALDPDHPSPGIRKNHRKRWADFKAKTGVTIKDS